jgi:hypothetical protein
LLREMTTRWVSRWQSYQSASPEACEISKVMVMAIVSQHDLKEHSQTAAQLANSGYS